MSDSFRCGADGICRLDIGGAGGKVKCKAHHPIE